ncbi:hypothetical protein BSK59_16170 [Paenibacillus odorifer]|uniref:hypothetical protein n=1 Tax=Paenibacillus odorifer TaxID=189426 RepID=UPI00096C563E|nr:hypothetical protein [Paenibacillus odorifer]OME54115.1 hypothetical protein BSK59_16170 [Paenibacillus odorifer]
MSDLEFLRMLGYVAFLRDIGLKFDFLPPEDEEDDFCLIVEYDDYNMWNINSIEKWQEFVEFAKDHGWLQE